MTETPERYEGMDDRHRGVLERFKAEDPESYEHLFGVPLFMEVGDVSATLKAYEERAEKAERALLECWFNAEWDRCTLCEADGAVTFLPETFPIENHAEDCIVPGIMERYAE